MKQKCEINFQRIEELFRNSNQTYIFPRIDSDESIQSVTDYRTIESPKVYRQKLKPPKKRTSYKALLTELEEKLQLINNRDSKKRTKSNQQHKIVEPPKGTDYLLALLQRYKSKSNEKTVFNVQNSNINLNFNISRTIAMQDRKTATRSSTSQQRNSTRCITEPDKKSKPHSRCTTHIDKVGSTQSYLEQHRNRYKKPNLNLEL